MYPSQFWRYTGVCSFATLLLFSPQGSQALPADMSPVSFTAAQSPNEARGFNGMGLVTLQRAVRDFLKDKNAWDPIVPDKCSIEFSTFAGGSCQVLVNCEMSDKHFDTLPPWNVCYLHGRQYLTHPGIGDFSIEFTKAGGVDGETQDGLHHPILQFANLNNWEKFDVQASIDGWTEDHGNLCKNGREGDGDQLFWVCGIPKVGTAAFGLSNFEPVDNAPGYTAGVCTMHVVQHQKNEYGVGAEYKFDVVIYDAAKKIIGNEQLVEVDAKTKRISVTSHLPYTVEVIAGGLDSDPVAFEYSGQKWKSGDGTHGNTLGTTPEDGYESGNREGDMEFDC